MRRASVQVHVSFVVEVVLPVEASGADVLEAAIVVASAVCRGGSVGGIEAGAAVGGSEDGVSPPRMYIGMAQDDCLDCRVLF